MGSQLTWRAWNLVGLTVSRIQIDRQIHLEIQAPDCALTLSFQSECYLQVANRIRHTLITSQPDTLAPLLPVLHQPLVRFMVSTSGHCKLLLANSTVIWADPAAGQPTWISRGEGSLGSASIQGEARPLVRQ
ncbi:MAG: hypothetical protein AAFR42_11545 [Cyanobacteria bacterium J06628_6]